MGQECYETQFSRASPGGAACTLSLRHLAKMPASSSPSSASLTSSSASSSKMNTPTWKTTIPVALLTLGYTCVCAASPPSSPYARSQIPFSGNPTVETASYTAHSSASTSSHDISLHRLCLPPSKADEHWPSILDSLASLEAHQPEYPLDIWTPPRLMRHTYDDDGSELLMSPDVVEESSCLDFTYSSHTIANRLLDEMVHSTDRTAELDWNIMADEDELRRRVDAQKGSAKAALETAANGEDPFHSAYHRLANITSYLSYLVSQNPNMAEMVDIGTTYEGRVIEGIRLGKRHAQDGDDDGDKGRKEVVIVAGAHGREWITTSTALYLVSTLLSNPSYLSTFSVVVIPVLNPDGFEHTWNTDRFFRKNRELVSGHDWWGRKCYGVDVARNFPVNFRRPSFGSNPCSPTYAGDEALSTSEAKSLADYLNSTETSPIAFIDLHSYGQLILHPWLSCTSSLGEDVPDEEDLSEMAIGASRAAKAIHGKSYRVGRGCEAMYNQDGSAVDYAYGGQGIKYSFEFELRDEGSYGFTLPADQIKPTAQEVWSGLEYLLRFIKGREKLA